MASQLLINEPPLQVLPTLARHIGLNEAIVLQQIHYWLSPQFHKNVFEGRYWVRNTYGQWQRQFSFWGEKTIRRTIANLEKLGLLTTFVTGGFNKVKYYTINYAYFEQLDALSSNGTMRKGSSPTQTINFEKAPEKQGSSSSGHNDQIDLPKRADRDGQLDQIDQVNLTRHLENTPENTYLPPPLTPPPQFAARAEEEEEEKELYFEQENSHWNSVQAQILPRIDTSTTEEKAMQEQQIQEPELCLEMVTLWNQIVQNKLSAGSEAYLTNKRKAHLNQFLKEVLHNTTRAEQIDAWQNYCTLIARTRFLMGHNPNGFKATLDWATVPENAFKVLEGAYYDKPGLTKDEPICLSWEEFSEELARTLPSSKYLTQWVKMSVIIAKFIGQEKYKSWFTKVTLSEVTKTTAIFEVEGQFTKDSIIRYFSSEIRCAVQSLYPKVNQIEFKVVASLGDRA